MTSFCPKLGKTYAEEFKGSCPSHLQEPFGKTLKISFAGLPPYIIGFIDNKPLGGSDILVTKILAKKFGFIPKFIPARGPYASHDQVRNDNPLACIIHAMRVISIASLDT